MYTLAQNHIRDAIDVCLLEKTLGVILNQCKKTQCNDV